MKVIVEFDHTELKEAEVASKASTVVCAMSDFESYMRTKIKHGNHGEEALKAMLDVQQAYYDFFEGLTE